ncbi:hypothetical protein RhiirA4_456289 [Rhizophagus irregularis]|uniref:Uncharacterized protein n=1 Tax=Rhizophagus irregularis TaxID=588596 RepID=A0A2I1G754_9GLOM|nr:hypothetical protein RhiirA4_456289 [Rhizophagus irregularis]
MIASREKKTSKGGIQSPISKVPAFLVARFEGSHLLVTHFEGSCLSSRPFSFRRPKGSTGRNCFERNWYDETLGSGISKYWTNEIGLRNLWTDGISSSAWWILNKISRSWTSFRRVPDLNDLGLKVPSGSRFEIGTPGLIFKKMSFLG